MIRVATSCFAKVCLPTMRTAAASCPSPELCLPLHHIPNNDPVYPVVACAAVTKPVDHT
jgi:hypothetical protein